MLIMRSLFGGLARRSILTRLMSSDADAALQINNRSDGITLIRLNRPKKFNAITYEMYDGITNTLCSARDDPNVKAVAFTGTGKYYCAGNDLMNFASHMAAEPEEIKELVKNAGNILEKFVDSFIQLEKPLLAFVNGPAVGIAVTTLGLFDSVVAVDNATFNTPFTILGQSPEACSTVTFPAIMGNAASSEILLFNRTYKAQEMRELGLVSDVVAPSNFESHMNSKLDAIGKLPIKSLVYSKQLIRRPHRERLQAANKAECERLVERWASEDCKEAVINFIQSRSSSKL